MRTKRSRILLIDDDPASLALLSCMLTDYSVHEVESAPMALEALRESEFDLVISDVNMPEMNGLQFLQELKKMRKVPPVVLVSGGNAMRIMIKGCELGALSFLAKPFTEKQLHDELDFALRGSRTSIAA